MSLFLGLVFRLCVVVHTHLLVPAVGTTGLLAGIARPGLCSPASSWSSAPAATTTASLAFASSLPGIHLWAWGLLGPWLASPGSAVVRAALGCRAGLGRGIWSCWRPGGLRLVRGRDSPGAADVAASGAGCGGEAEGGVKWPQRAKQEPSGEPAGQALPGRRSVRAWMQAGCGAHGGATAKQARTFQGTTDRAKLGLKFLCKTKVSLKALLCVYRTTRKAQKGWNGCLEDVKYPQRTIPVLLLNSSARRTVSEHSGFRKTILSPKVHVTRDALGREQTRAALN